MLTGQHRQFGTHIAKIKSVNLDLWPEGKVEVFSALNNNLVNSYWEANLPPHFQKPTGNASGEEVRRFLTDKYVNKRYIDSKMKHDPLWLFENRPSKFQRFLKKRMQGGSDDDDQEEVVKKPEVKTEVKLEAKQPEQKAFVGDLLNFSQSSSAPDGFEGF
jgi:hypothetical protein